MTGTELQQRRVSLDLSVDRLAEMLDEHRDVVQQWEQITKELPRSLSRRLDWVLALEERTRLMQASGIEECSWTEEYLKNVDQLTPDQMERRLAEAEKHSETCAVCQRRKAYADTLPPLPPAPLSPSFRVLIAITDRIQRLPKWVRPAAAGALLIGGLTLVRAVFVVVFRRSPISPSLLLTILAAIGVGAYGGAVGGLAYTLVRDRFRKFGRVGDYLTGLTCVYAYLLAFGIPLAVFTREEMFREPVGWIIMIIIGAVFGLIIGHSWFREEPQHGARGA